MCRMAAYLGPSIRLQQFLLQPEHSLVVQAYAPQELVYAKVNADGFGIGWYNQDNQPTSYRNTRPIWSDPNLANLAGVLEADLWLANVRSATPGNPVNHSNTQPFYHGDLLFMHNGYIGNFIEQIRPRLFEFLDNEILAGVQGNCDSEYLFALIRHFLADNEDMAIEEAIAESFSLLDDWLGNSEALLNVIISDGELLYAARHAINHDSPSLYYSTDDESFADAQLIASERLTSEGLWQPVPEHEVLVLSADEPPELLAL